MVPAARTVVLHVKPGFWNAGSRPHMRMAPAWVTASPDRRQRRMYGGVPGSIDVRMSGMPWYQGGVVTAAAATRNADQFCRFIRDAVQISAVEGTPAIGRQGCLGIAGL